METRGPGSLQEQNLRLPRCLEQETGLHYNTFRFYDPDGDGSRSQIRSGCRVVKFARDSARSVTACIAGKLAPTEGHVGCQTSNMVQLMGDLARCPMKRCG